MSIKTELEKAWGLGFCASPSDKNPYLRNTPEFKEWKEGLKQRTLVLECNEFLYNEEKELYHFENENAYKSYLYDTED